MLPTVAERAACPGHRAGDLAKKMTKGEPRGVVGGRLLWVGGESQGSVRPPGHEDEQHPPR